MRTKTQIKERITVIQHDRDAYSGRLYKQTMNAEINTLRWVLGYKNTERYWCTYCLLAHQNIKCPKCGDNNYSGTHHKENK